MSKNEAADRLSDLCDPLLHHILSYLDMKEVVHTSLLSRRWRYTWKSVSHLNFDHTLWDKSVWKKTRRGHFRYKSEFMDFIDYVLFLRDGSNIHKFHLNGSSYCKYNRLTKWLTVTVERKVQDIYLEIRRSVTLPPFIFTRPMNLKTLHLVSAQLQENKSNGELVLRCPVLETLILTCCDHNHLNILDIFAPQLKNLRLENDGDDRVGYVVIKIYAPNLILLKCNGYMYREFSMENISSLVTATFIYRGFSRTSVHHFVKVLKGLQNVATLELTNCWFKEMFHPSATYWGEDMSLPYKLRKLRINNPEGYENELKFLEIILNNAMDLESITITARARTETHCQLLNKFNQKLHSFPRASERKYIRMMREEKDGKVLMIHSSCYDQELIRILRKKVAGELLPNWTVYPQSNLHGNTAIHPSEVFVGNCYNEKTSGFFMLHESKFEDTMRATETNWRNFHKRNIYDNDPNNKSTLMGWVTTLFFNDPEFGTSFCRNSWRMKVYTLNYASADSSHQQQQELVLCVVERPSA